MGPNDSTTSAPTAPTKSSQEILDEQFAEEIKQFFPNATEIRPNRAQGTITFTLVGAFTLTHGDFCDRRPRLQLSDLHFAQRETGGHTVTVRKVVFPKAVVPTT